MKLSMQVRLKQFCTGCGIILMCDSIGPSFTEPENAEGLLLHLKHQWDNLKKYNCPKCEDQLEEIDFYEEPSITGRRYEILKKNKKKK